jgi:hypothetical protein
LSDEVKRRCANCGMVVYNYNPSVAILNPNSDEPNQAALQSRLDELVELAISLGGSAATVVDAKNILVEDHLANLCREARCPNYGLSPTCPPHVEGPEWLRSHIKKTSFALVFEIEVSLDRMYPDRRRKTGQLLHFIVIQLEFAAIEIGILKKADRTFEPVKKRRDQEQARAVAGLVNRYLPDHPFHKSDLRMFPKDISESLIMKQFGIHLVFSTVGAQNGNESLDVHLGDTTDGWGYSANGRFDD